METIKAMQVEKENVREAPDACLQRRNNEIEISVIVPMYNMEKYVEECVRSILDQTYKNFEVILVDDGSSDTSYEIAQQLALEDYRISVFHKENEGVSVARNTGMEIAGGRWIMFVDPDDTLEPSLIEELLSFANIDADIVACCCNVIFEDKKQIDYFFPSDRWFSTLEEKEDLYKQLMNASYGQPGDMFTAIGVPWGKLYRASFLRENHLTFIPRLRRYQDNIFNMYAFFYARLVVYVNKPLYDYRAERITQYKKNYKPGFLRYMSDLCEERYRCMKTLGLLQEDDLQEFFRREMRSRIFKILHEDIFSAYNKDSFHEKVEQTRELCEKECFEPLIQGSREGFSRRQRLQMDLMKRGRYRILCILVALGRMRRGAD